MALTSPDRAAAERSAHFLRGLEWLMVPVVMALGFMLASFAVRNSDFWLHLATGRLIASGDYSFGVDPFSHASAGRYWINHAWLFDLVIYKLYALAPSHSAVVYFKGGLMALLALVMILAGRPESGKRIVPGTKVDPSGWVAAIAVGIGLLAISSRMLMQPVLVSYLFAAITFMVLQSSRGWPAWGLPATLAGIFILWVNCDSWFMLGPLLVALFLAGELIQGLVPGSAPVENSRIKNLAATLVVGLAACLVSPHHYHVFTVLPTELSPNIVRGMQYEFSQRGQFLSPLDQLYLRSPALGRSIAGFSYLALIIASLGSFVLTGFRPRVAWLLVWAGCLALGLLNWRLIPFFAVVSAPILALNVQMFFARRPERRFESSPAPEPVPPPESVPASQPVGAAASTEPPRDAWWPGATEPAPSRLPAPISAPPRPAKSPSMTVTPEGMLAFASIFGRLLTILVGLLALAAAYPGWLHGTTSAAAADYRLGWEVIPNPAYQQMAERLAELRREGKLPADAKGMPLHPTIGHYLAWFAPEEKGFLDLRFQLLGDLSHDYIQVKNGLNEVGEGVARPTDYGAVLRRRGVNHVLIADADREEFERFLAIMIVNPNEWSLWFQNGRTAVFGWREPDPKRSEPPLDPLRLDLLEQAFSPKGLRVRAPETSPVARLLPPDPSLEQKRTFFDVYLSPPPPAAAPETDAARTYIYLQPYAQDTGIRQTANNVFVARIAGTVGRLANPGPPMLGPPETLDIPVPQNHEQFRMFRLGQFHTVPLAFKILTVREAIRGVLAQPNAGRAHLILAHAYNQLPPVSTEFRALQIVTAGRQALARLTNEQQVSNELGQMVTLTLMSLVQEHNRRHERDLAYECLSRAVVQFERFPPPNLSEKELESTLATMNKELERMKLDVEAAQNAFENDLQKDRQFNRPLQAQVLTALRYGLVREALKLLEESSDQLDISTWPLLIGVRLSLGQAEEAQDILRQLPEQFRAQFAPLQILVWVALCDYARVGKVLDEQIAVQERHYDPKVKQRILSLALVRMCLASCDTYARPAGLCAVRENLEFLFGKAAEFGQFDQQRAELQAARAMLALEEGDVAAARQSFKAALAIPIRFREPRDQANAAAYLRALDEFAPK